MALFILFNCLQEKVLSHLPASKVNQKAQKAPVKDHGLGLENVA